MEVFLNLTVSRNVRKLCPSQALLRRHSNVAIAAEQRSRLPEVVKHLSGSRERTRRFLNEFRQDVFQFIVVLRCSFSNTSRKLGWLEV